MSTGITRCTECIHHKIVADPDPYDWFNDDDCAVRCMKSSKSPTLSEQGAYKIGDPMVTVACRPYMVDKESDIPDWCPLKS